jgi:hypothetical protein
MREFVFGGLVFIYLVFQFMGLVGDGVFFGSEEMDILNYITGVSVTEMTHESWIGLVIRGLQIPLGFLQFAWSHLLLWDYSYLTGGWALFKFFVLIPITASMIWAGIRTFRGGG